MTLRSIISGDRFVRFLLVGLPAFLLAVPLNAVLVEMAHLDKPAAYALVLVFQVVSNFALCRRFVFPEGRRGAWTSQFVQFVGSILLFRVFDWMLYSWLVGRYPGYYPLFQLANVAVFSLLKFVVSRAIFLRKSTSQDSGS